VPSTAAASGAAYQVAIAQDPKLGAYLTGEDGKSLYLLTADAANKTTCTGGCASAWPPFELDPGETVTPGTGVTGTLATMTRADDGKQQVTYNGIPLYYFGKDTKAGDIGGQGVKGVWFLAAPAATAAGGAITGGAGQGSPSAAPSASSSY
jgi:predicted lipoprotein with Yx(FWY)xxD motif